MRMQSYSSSRASVAPTVPDSRPAARVGLLYACVVAVVMLFGIRLFYVQIIRYSYYKQAALSDQLKQYEIPATRGTIAARDGDSVVPIVLNQELYTLYADPLYVKHVDQVAAQLVRITHDDVGRYMQLMQTPSARYVVLAKKLSVLDSGKILALKIPGIGTQVQSYRTYPQGALGAQLLGFVDTEGTGQYGLEQALNKRLSGKTGQVKAVTDVNGVPLAATAGNVETPSVNGDNIVTTIDLSMQSEMERILANQYQKTNSKGLSAIILGVNSGQIKAMANYPTYDPNNYQNATDPSVFQNAVVANAIEPGSIMKILTTAAALDQGVVQPDSSFYDPAHWLVDGFNITDIEQDGGARTQTVSTILSLSLNTGATWLLMQMSHPGGTVINQQGIEAWHNYLVGHYHFGAYTNVEQGYESPGYVPSPKSSGSAVALTYANTSFGQGIQITPLQMAAAISAAVNGGTYYQPTLIDQITNATGVTTTQQPLILSHIAVKPSTSMALQGLLENVVTIYANGEFGYMHFPSNYIVGGKTGTAQIARPEGGYYPDKFNGTYAGFVGGDKPQYVVVVYNTEPHVVGYAGSHAGQPVFADLVHMLIDNSFVTPKSH
jgi:cell division protein FtsI/penicillin-binding protein 2